MALSLTAATDSDEVLALICKHAPRTRGKKKLPAETNKHAGPSQNFASFFFVTVFVSSCTSRWTVRYLIKPPEKCTFSPLFATFCKKKKNTESVSVLLPKGTGTKATSLQVEATPWLEATAVARKRSPLVMSQRARFSTEATGAKLLLPLYGGVRRLAGGERDGEETSGK